MKDDLIYGMHVIQQFLDRKPEDILELFFAESREDKRADAVVSLASELGVRVQRVSRKQLDLWLKEANHQGIAAKVRQPLLYGESDLPQLIEALKTPPLFLVLDGVQDPHNLGACLRTADAANVTAVIIPKDRAATITPVVRKVASGAAETVPVVSVVNLARTLEYLKTLGVWIAGTSLQATQSLYELDFKGSMALVLGAEGQGLRRLTEAQCDHLVSLPMQGTVESLNVSVAAGIALYEALRQRLFTK